ncbi:MAG: HD domain-containing protein [Coriobacteriia bacterium]|nr:HD domain-containing protein [Coriobacteriia bacterium]
MPPVDVIARYLDRRFALLSSVAPGGAAARSLSDLTDSAVAAIAETALSSLRTPWALLAVGGWGSRRLLPGSDLDLLVITDAPASELKPALEKVLYPLWDSGLTVGHQVRTRRDHARMVRDDLDTLTATLTGRYLAGDEALAMRLLAECAAGARKRAKRLLARLAQRDRPGSPYLLEPDLKEGAGGQRDLDELTWTAAVLAGSTAHAPSALGDVGVLREGEVARLEAAGELVTAARWVVQRATSRAGSRLTSDVADEIDASRLQTAVADIHHLTLLARARVSGRPLSWDAPDAPGMTHQQLFALLDAGADSLGELEDAAWSGRLDDVVPGFADLMGMRRPALTHLYTVGAHSLRCALSVGAAAGGRVLTSQRRTVQAAALLHDIGKVQAGPGHPVRGAKMASTILPRLGLTPHEARDAVVLIAEHLLLAETAATEDIHDEDVLLRAAAKVERAELVTSLLALSEADALATGPGAWTPWHATLLGELADRLETALSDDVEGAGLAGRAEQVRAAALATLGPDAAPALTAFVDRAHLRYLASQRPADVASHARMVAAVSEPGAPPVQTAVTPGPASGTWRVTVAAPDRRGLFASVAGALALAGLDILTADAFPAPGAVALDVFAVRPDTLADAGTETWASFDRFLTLALEDHLALDIRLAERRRHYSRGTTSEPTVSVEASTLYATALYVTATDRVGLLYDLARAIEESGLDIRMAKATTRGHIVRDVFHVVDSLGEPVDDPGVLGHLSMRIRERV